MRALIDVFIAVQWVRSHLLDTKQSKFPKSSTPLHPSRDVVDDIGGYEVENVQIQEAKPHAHLNANFKSINIC